MLEDTSVIENVDNELPTTIGCNQDLDEEEGSEVINKAAAMPKAIKKSTVTQSLASNTSPLKKHKTKAKFRDASEHIMKVERDFLMKIEAIKNDSTNTTQWKLKSDALHYKVQCVETVENYREKGWTDKRIAATFSELQEFLNVQVDTMKQSKKKPNGSVEINSSSELSSD